MLRKKMKMSISSMMIGLMFLLTGLVSAVEDDVKANLENLAKGAHRSQAHIDRNKYRNPVETLAFFGVKEEMTVVEISPGRSGWYTEILAPFLKEKGRFVAAGYDKDSENERVRKAYQAFKEKLDEHPDVYGKVELGVIGGGKIELGPDDSADMVLTFRNVHNWMPGTVTEVFASFYKVLKPGGVLGVVEHRADPKIEASAKSGNGYVNQEYVIKVAEAAGFVLVASSEINANAKDARDHPSGVWTLPPVLAKGEENRDKYLAIGESDRMTLKFVKP